MRTAGIIVSNAIRVLSERLLASDGSKHGAPNVVHFIENADKLDPYSPVEVSETRDGVFTYPVDIVSNHHEYPAVTAHLTVRISNAGEVTLALTSDDIAVADYSPKKIRMKHDAIGSLDEDDIQNQLYPLAAQFVEDIWLVRQGEKAVHKAEEIQSHLGPFNAGAHGRIEKAKDALKSAIR